VTKKSNPFCREGVCEGRSDREEEEDGREREELGCKENCEMGLSSCKDSASSWRIGGGRNTTSSSLFLFFIILLSI
jgi:hypothetical protein